MNTPVELHRGPYTDEEYAPFIEGKLPLPNWEEAPVAELANNVAALGHSLHYRWGYSRVGAEPYKAWTAFFLGNQSNMGSQPDGSGYAIRYGSSGAIAGRFAICKHEKLEGAGADHRRGWHPGRCGKCGLDMTIDSGD